MKNWKINNGLFFVTCVLFLTGNVLNAGVDLQISGALVETTGSPSVQITGDVAEINNGYFKGIITSGPRPAMIGFAGFGVNTAMNGTITRMTGAPYNKGNGEPVNFKRYYTIENSANVSSGITIEYVSSGNFDERNGLVSPYFVYRYDGNWNFYGAGSSTPPVSGEGAQIPAGSSDWLIADFVDAENDGIPDVVENGTGDRDGDGIPNEADMDPTGWIYDEANGQIVSGGTISITPPSGVTVIHDGSNGYYQFATSQNGGYTLSYTPPAGYTASLNCPAQQGILDANPPPPNPLVVGLGSQSGSTGVMTNWNCNDNPYYMTFYLEAGDQIVINNNIPLRQLQQTFTISGQVTINGSGLDGVIISFFDGNTMHQEITAGGGYSSHTVSTGWSGTVTPTMAGYSFTPASAVVGPVTGNIVQDFAASQPISVELVYFNAGVEKTAVVLSWETASESNHAGFNLYRRSTGNEDFLLLNKDLIPAEGNSVSGHLYRYIDCPEKNGKYFYQLEDISLAGQTTRHKPVEIDYNVLPLNFSIYQNYPNPFNPSTSIRYELPEKVFVSINIYDTGGRLVRRLVEEEKSAGTFTVSWDRTDDRGKTVAGGVYFYRMVAGDFVRTLKMTLVK